MSYLFIKIAAVGGATAATGGIVASSSMFSGSKGESTTYKTTSSNLENKEVMDEPSSTPNEQTESSNGFTPITKGSQSKVKKCVILVTETVENPSASSRITKILKKYESSEGFLKTIGEGAFKTDVQQACAGQKNEVHQTDDYINVYVYQKKDQTWNYTRHIQQDWISKGVSVSETISE